MCVICLHVTVPFVWCYENLTLLFICNQIHGVQLLNLNVTAVIPKGSVSHQFHSEKTAVTKKTFGLKIGIGIKIIDIGIGIGVKSKPIVFWY